jgi:hypothetical protein
MFKLLVLPTLLLCRLNINSVLAIQCLSAFSLGWIISTCSTDGFDGNINVSSDKCSDGQNNMTTWWFVTQHTSLLYGLLWGLRGKIQWKNRGKKKKSEKVFSKLNLCSNGLVSCWKIKWKKGTFLLCCTWGYFTELSTLQVVFFFNCGSSLLFTSKNGATSSCRTYCIASRLNLLWERKSLLIVKSLSLSLPCYLLELNQLHT